MLRELRPGEYLRYVDDFLLFGTSRAALEGMRERIVEHLAGRLRLGGHEGKSRVYRTCDGVTFLGWRITPSGGMRLKRSNVVGMRRRLRALVSGDRAVLRARVQAWIGHARHGRTWRLREQLFAEFPFVWGEG